MSFFKDYSFGKSKECEIIDKINILFNDNIKIVSNPKSRYDFEGDKYIYELKSRNNKYLTYPTTLIPFNKLNHKSSKRLRFLFLFTDGLYYITYRKRIFDTFELKEFCRRKRIDFNDKPELYYYIPIESLKKLDI
jgi:hypothetical protein